MVIRVEQCAKFKAIPSIMHKNPQFWSVSPIQIWTRVTRWTPKDLPGILDYHSTPLYSEAIMSAMASQITGVLIVYSTVCSGADQRKHQSSASVAFVRGIIRSPVNSPLKGPVTRKMFLFDDVFMKIGNKFVGLILMLKSPNLKITPGMPKMSQSNFVSLSGYLMSCNAPWLSNMCGLSTKIVFQRSFKISKTYLLSYPRDKFVKTVVQPSSPSRNISCIHRHHFMQPSLRRIFSTSNNQKTRVDGGINRLYMHIWCRKWGTAGFVRAHQRKYWNVLRLSSAAMKTMVAAVTTVRFPPVLITCF